MISNLKGELSSKRFNMRKEQKEQLKEKILSDIEKLDKEIATLKEESKPIAPDCCLGDLIREELIIKQNVTIKTLQEYESRVKKLRFSLSKIDTQEYGICQECEEEIAFARLKLLPESTHCVSCLEELKQ